MNKHINVISDSLVILALITALTVVGSVTIGAWTSVIELSVVSLGLVFVIKALDKKSGMKNNQ